MEIVKSQVASYGFQVVNGIIPLTFLAIMFSVYDFDAMAIYFIALSISGLLVMVVDFGFNLSPIRDLEVLNLEEVIDIVPEKLWLIVFSKLIIFLITTPILFLLSMSAWSPLPTSILVCVCMISVLTSVTNIQWFLFALNESIVFAMALFGFRIFSVFIFVLIYFSIIDMSIEIASIFLLSIPLLANLYVLYRYKNYFTLKSARSAISLPKIMRESTRSAKIFINTSIDSGVKLSWPLVLLWLSGSKELVSTYGAIERLVKMVYLLFSPLPFFLLANATAFSTLRDTFKLLPFRRLIIFVTLGFLAAPFLVYFVITITKWPFGDSIFGYDLSIIALYIFHPYLIIANLLVYTFLVHHNREILLTMALIVSAIGIVVIVLAKLGPVLLYPLYYDLLVVGILIILMAKKLVFGDRLF